jgi:Cu-Zn family superoxide dismutase
MKYHYRTLGLLALPLCSFACKADPGTDMDVRQTAAPLEPNPGAAAASPPAPLPKPEPVAVALEATAHFIAVPGSKLHGDAQLMQTVDGVMIEVDIADAPTGLKGMHVHEKPDCSDIAGKSMGSHFAPDHHEHGLPQNQRHHLGDLGNISVAAGGTGTAKELVRGATLVPGDAHSLLNRSIVIHEGEDHGPGDPSGKSGKPMACAVIEAKK